MISRKKFGLIFMVLFIILSVVTFGVTSDNSRVYAAPVQGAVDPENPTVPATVGNGGADISIRIGDGTAGGQVSALEILFLLAFLALLPSFLLMMTSFLRIIITLSFLKNAMGTQVPPSQVLIGIALFLTFFIMTPTIKEINDVAYKPYDSGAINATQAVKAASVPLKKIHVDPDL